MKVLTEWMCPSFLVFLICLWSLGREIGVFAQGAGGRLAS